MLPHITLESEPPANACVIWLHGLGASCEDFPPLVPHLGLPDSLPVRFIFPQAPDLPVTINGGHVMPAWYDILSLDLERKIDPSQLLASADAIAALVRREMARGIPSRRIVLAGFSQGGAVAYQTGLGFAEPLGGILALSTYIASPASLTCHPANRATPIALFHGARDDVVPEVMGRHAWRWLREQGYAVDWHRYDQMAHEACLEEAQDIGRCLVRWLEP